ncbi:hypothetical protein CSAL01_05702 [Colletotrichum salicis]|uniref:Berberine/berberine-like domain-containing protein n=1 Tax=Colletotrichum salicis TaxID=1209931 RepID=A0A135UJ37_9PEZI|nr:hypothetical protein CSAL01_05702 [Colletotrichum salicis]
MSGTLTARWIPLNNSLNPVWRDAALHLVAAQGWDDSDAPEIIDAAVDRLMYTSLEALRELDPTSGAYLNELRLCSQRSQASTFEPGWQTSFFGVNYPLLRFIKARYDPNDLLWCPNCVGSEGWVQQEEETLCRAFRPL